MQLFTPEQLEQIKMQQEEAAYEAKVVAFRCTRNGRVFPYSATLFKHRVKMKLQPLLEMPEELVAQEVEVVPAEASLSVAELEALLAAANAQLEDKSPEAEAKPKSTSRRAKVEQAE
jgi:hypothetical protein